MDNRIRCEVFGDGQEELEVNEISDEGNDAPAGHQLPGRDAISELENRNQSRGAEFRRRTRAEPGCRGPRFRGPEQKGEGPSASRDIRPHLIREPALPFPFLTEAHSHRLREVLY